MSKIKWILIVIGLIDTILILLRFTNYFVLFLKPTSYLIPLLLNFMALTSVLFLSKTGKKWLKFAGITIVFIPIMLFQGLYIMFFDKIYTQIHSPHHNQTLVIEYRHAVLGEANYMYEFYKTKYGVIGKWLKNESLDLVDYDRLSSIDAKKFLGVGNEDWMGTHTVRFFTGEGIKEVNLSSFPSLVNLEYTEESIDRFIDIIENKESDQSIWVKRNLFTTRYDETTNQFWIDVTSENDEGEIPTQQCSYIERDKESMHYKLMECTHQWEYILYPILK